MKILVTGSRGFVGGSFSRFAIRAGHEVLGVGRAAQREEDWSAAYVQADVANADLSPIFREFQPDAVLHAAGSASVGASFATPLDDMRAAVLTFANTLAAIRKAAIRPVVLFPSSAAVYGNPERLPVEEDAPITPLSPYGFHKATCELIARQYAQCFDLPIICGRLFSVFGERQRRLLVWELYQQFAGKDDVVWLRGTGTESRDYLHIDDISAAFLQLANCRLAHSGFAAVNIARGEELSVRTLAENLRVASELQKEIRCRGITNPGDPHRWVADVGVLRAKCPDWKPAALDDSLRRCVRNWNRHSHTVDAMS